MKYIVLKTKSNDIYSGECSYIDATHVGFRIAILARNGWIYTFFAITKKNITHFMDLRDALNFTMGNCIDDYPAEADCIPSYAKSESSHPDHA